MRDERILLSSVAPGVTVEETGRAVTYQEIAVARPSLSLIVRQRLQNLLLL